MKVYDPKQEATLKVRLTNDEDGCVYLEGRLDGGDWRRLLFIDECGIKVIWCANLRPAHKWKSQLRRL